MTLSFARKLPGQRVRRNGRLVCVKPVPGNGSARRCTRYQRVRTRISLRATAGLNRVIFYGRLSTRRSLTPASYRLTAVAHDGDGTGSRARRARFRLLPTKK